MIIPGRKTTEKQKEEVSYCCESDNRPHPKSVLSFFFVLSAEQILSSSVYRKKISLCEKLIHTVFFR